MGLSKAVRETLVTVKNISMSKITHRIFEIPYQYRINN